MTNLINSKRRVADHGEVFTPPGPVEKMLDIGRANEADLRVLSRPRLRQRQFPRAHPATQAGGREVEIRQG